MQSYGHLETRLSIAEADLGLTFRNLGWSGDTVWGDARAVFGQRADGYKRLQKDTAEAKPTTILVCYGANEAHAGKAGLAEFTQGLNRLLDFLASTKARIVIISPHRHEKMPAPLPDPAAYNAKLKLYVGVLRQAAKTRGYHFVDLFSVPMEGLTTNGVHLSVDGYAIMSVHLARGLSVDPGQPVADSKQLAQLREAIRAKNELHFHRYRPQNETYLFLFRKHEQGNNAVEIPQFDQLVEKQEKLISELSKSLGNHAK